MDLFDGHKAGRRHVRWLQRMRAAGTGQAGFAAAEALKRRRERAANADFMLSTRAVWFIVYATAATAAVAVLILSAYAYPFVTWQHLRRLAWRLFSWAVLVGMVAAGWFVPWRRLAVRGGWALVWLFKQTLSLADPTPPRRPMTRTIPPPLPPRPQEASTLWG